MSFFRASFIMKLSAPNIRRSALLLVWAGSLVLAWWMGSGPERNRNDETRKRRVAEGAGPGSGLLSGREARAVSGAARENGGKAAAQSGTGSGRKSQDFGARLADIKGMEPGPQRNEAYFELIKDWAMADGPAALEAATAITEPKLRFELRESALRHWAQASPEAAWKFVRSNPNGDLPENRLELVFDGLGRSEAGTALAFFENHREEMLKHGDRAAYVVDELYERGNHGTLVAWAEKMPAGKLRDIATNRIIDRWARYDPVAAKEWMDHMVTGKENLVPARIELAESWARVNPESALQWANGLPAGQRDPEYYNRIYGRWIQYDRNAAAKYLAAQPPSPQLDQPIERYTNEVMRQNPADTMPWAESINDEKRRWRAIERVAEVWSRRDRQGLETYVTASRLTEEQKRQLLRKEGK